MRKTVLLTSVAVMVFITINKSIAETWNCGDQGNNVQCTLDEDGTFTVSGNGKMADYGRSDKETMGNSDAPWGGTRENLSKIKNIIIEDGVTSVGTWAFAGATQVESIYMPSVKTISNLSFYDQYSVTSIYMPNVESIGKYSFSYAFSLESVDMPKVKEIDDYAFNINVWDPINLKYVGLPEGVILGNNVFGVSPVATCGTEGGTCLTCAEGENYMPDVGCVADCGRGYFVRNRFCVSASDGCGSGYLEKDSVCISSSLGCGEGYKDMGGFCNHIRWTPAEAAEVLTDDNNNSVTITFKK